jgi:hypothetical protein
MQLFLTSRRRHLDRYELFTECGFDRVGDAIEDHLIPDVVDLPGRFSSFAARRPDLASAG